MRNPDCPYANSCVGFDDSNCVDEFDLCPYLEYYKEQEEKEEKDETDMDSDEIRN